VDYTVMLLQHSITHYVIHLQWPTSRTVTRRPTSGAQKVGVCLPLVQRASYVTTMQTVWMEKTKRIVVSTTPWSDMYNPFK